MSVRWCEVGVKQRHPETNVGAGKPLVLLEVLRTAD